MRTTFLLDPDVQRLIEPAARQSGRSFEQVLNDAVRAGLASHPAPALPFKQRVFSLGHAKVDLQKAGALAGELEDECTIARYHAAHSEPPAHS
jgi:hypothetical protein